MKFKIGDNVIVSTRNNFSHWSDNCKEMVGKEYTIIDYEDDGYILNNKNTESVIWYDDELEHGTNSLKRIVVNL